jgi:pimeloyl-ACP methyl ester carboxylesterase
VTAPDLIAPPGGSLLRTEARAARELPRLLLRAPQLLRAPRGRGPVVAFPGYGTSDVATAPVRGFLRSLGHRPHGWAMGVNGGDVEELVPPATERVREVVDRSGEPAALVGWSLGGVIAREIARDEPDLVRHVVTYGTPVVGGPRYTRSASAYGEERVRAIELVVTERNKIPIEVPVTAIYSRRDGAVAWRACLDDFSPDVANIEVTSSHVGMGVDPDVWRIIARTLAT